MLVILSAAIIRVNRSYLSNGHSPANLSNSSTLPKFAIFVEFEYSPKWSFWKIGWTLYIRQHSPTCFGRTRYIRRHSPTYFARTRHTRPHSPKVFFEKNVTRLDTFARVISHTGEFEASGHCYIPTTYYGFMSEITGYC
jgi:hypothetical protein